MSELTRKEIESIVESAPIPDVYVTASHAQLREISEDGVMAFVQPNFRNRGRWPLWMKADGKWIFVRTDNLEPPKPKRRVRALPSMSDRIKQRHRDEPRCAFCNTYINREPVNGLYHCRVCKSEWAIARDGRETMIFSTPDLNYFDARSNETKERLTEMYEDGVLKFRNRAVAQFWIC